MSSRLTLNIQSSKITPLEALKKYISTEKIIFPIGLRRRFVLGNLSNLIILSFSCFREFRSKVYTWMLGAACEPPRKYMEILCLCVPTVECVGATTFRGYVVFSL